MKFKREPNCRYTTEDGRYTIRKSFVTEVYYVRDNATAKYLSSADGYRISFGWLRDAKKCVEGLYA